MPPQLEVRHLRLVHEVAGLGSVTRAAERLHLTQSALSHQLRDIETRLGTRLFDRLGRRMVLTRAGQRVLESAERILEELARVEDDVTRLAAPGRGIIRICTQCNTGYYWLPRLLQAFHRRFPAVDVRILVEATMNPVEHLLAGKLDVAVLTDRPADKRLRLHPLFQDEHVAVVSPSHRLASRAWIGAEDLAREHLILITQAVERSYVVRRVLQPAGVMPERISYVQLTEAILEMVKAGLGVSVLPRWTIEPSLRAGAIQAVRLTRRGLFRPWTAATLRAREDPPYLTAFIDLLESGGRQAAAH